MTDEPTTAALPSPPTREDYEAVMRTDGGQLHLLAISRATNNFEKAAAAEATKFHGVKSDFVEQRILLRKNWER